MAAKLLFIIVITIVIPIIYYFIFRGFQRKTVFWGIFWGIVSALPILCMYSMQHYGIINIFSLTGTKTASVVFSSSAEELCKGGMFFVAPIISLKRPNVVWLGLGFGLIENYLYFIHALNSFPAMALFLVIVLSRSLITIPSHIAYMSAYLLCKNRFIGFLLAACAHCTLNMLVTFGYTTMIIIPLLVYMLYLKKYIEVHT